MSDFTVPLRNCEKPQDSPRSCGCACRCCQSREAAYKARIRELEAERDTWMKVAAGAGNAEIFARERAEKAETEIIQLRAHLEEADELLEVAYYAHQKMGLEGEGNRGHSHEVRMFAMHFSQPETPQSPQHVILSGDGRYWRFRLRDMPAKPGSPSVPSPNQPPPAALDPAAAAVKAPPAAIHKDEGR